MRNTFRSSDGYDLAWHELAPGEHREEPPIVMQHGYTTSARDEWLGSETAARLTQRGRRVIGLDARGHGQSAAPHDPSAYGERRMARDVSELADHLDLKLFDLAGYSMGGVIALLVAVSDRRVRRLVVGGVGEAGVLLGGLDTRALVKDEIAALMRADVPTGVSSFWNSVREQAVARGNDRLALAAVAEAIEGIPIALNEITAPTLILAGDADPLAVRPHVLAEAIPGARLRMFPGGHEAAGTSRVFIDAVVDFLR